MWPRPVARRSGVNDKSESDPRADTPRSWTRDWAADSALLLASQLLTVLATSAAAIAIARALEPREWAIFSAFLGLSLALNLVVDFGLGTWLLRELSRVAADESRGAARIRAGPLLSSSAILNAGIAAPLVGAAIVWSIASRADASTAFSLVSLLAYGGLTASANALEAYMRALRNVTLVLGASLLEKSFLIVLLLGTIAADAGVAGIGLAYLGAGMTRVVFDAALLVFRFQVPFSVPRPAAVGTVARASLPFALNAGSLNLIPRLDTLVLLAMSSTSAAWFAIGDRVLGPALLVPATVGVALYPFMASRSARRTPPWKLALAMGAAGGVTALVGILLAPTVIPLLFGGQYRAAVPVVQVMLLILPLVYATNPLLVVAYSHGRERALLLPVAALSLAGTGAMAVGQAIGGPQLAAAGFVFRSALFLLVVGVVSIAAWRRGLVTPSAMHLPPTGSVEPIR